MARNKKSKSTSTQGSSPPPSANGARPGLILRLRDWMDQFLGHRTWQGIGAVAGIVGVWVTVALTNDSSASPEAGPLAPGLKDRLPDVALTMRYALPYSDRLPFGSMFSPEHSEGVDAAPLTVEQMHTEKKMIFDEKGKGAYMKEMVQKADASKFIAGYLLILNNQGSVAADFMQINLNVESHQTLPRRSIWMWHRKGLMKPEEVEISLLPRPGTFKIFPKDNSIIHLEENETLPIQINVKDAAAGVYSFSVTADALGIPDGRIASNGQQLAMPSTAVTSLGAMHIFCESPEPELARRINRLSDEQFRTLTANYLGRIPDAPEVGDYLRRTFHVMTSPKAAPDALERLQKTTLNGLKDIISEDPKEALGPIRRYIGNCPTAFADEARYLEVLALRDSGDAQLARVRAQELIRDIPESALGHYALWLLEKKVQFLNAALGLDPGNVIFIKGGINECIVHESCPVSRKLPLCFKRLSEADSLAVIEEVMTVNLLSQYGLALSLEAAHRLANFDQRFGVVLAQMPQNQHWKLSVPPPADVMNETVFNVMLQTGRIVSGKAYADRCGLPDLVLKALCCGRDLCGVSDLFEDPQHQPKNPDAYIAAALALLSQKKRERFDQVVSACRDQFPNQTRLVLGVAGIYDRKLDEGRRHLLLYLDGQSERMDGVGKAVFGRSEVFMTNLKGMRVFGGILESCTDANEKYDPIPRLWSQLHPSQDRRLTEWPINLGLPEWDIGREHTWLLSFMMEKSGIELKDQHLVRLPLGVGYVVDDEISKGYPVWGGASLDLCRRVLDDGDLFFKAGIYGARLTLEQVKASRIFSHALYEFWNAGNLERALALVDEALEFDPKFYDALVLKGAVFASLGRRGEAVKTGRTLASLVAVPVPPFMME